MLPRSLLAALAAVCLTLSPAAADPVTHGDLTIAGPSARPNLPNRPTAAYMTISNAGAADRLIGARSPAFGRIELHTMEMADGVMKMRMVEAIEVPEGGIAELKPGGLHLMLFDAKELYADGAEVAITLIFETAGEVEVTVPVLKRAGAAMGDGKMGDGKTGEGEKKHSH